MLFYYVRVTKLLVLLANCCFYSKLVPVLKIIRKAKYILLCNDQHFFCWYGVNNSDILMKY